MKPLSDVTQSSYFNDGVTNCSLKGPFITAKPMQDYSRVRDVACVGDLRPEGVLDGVSQGGRHHSCSEFSSRYSIVTDNLTFGSV